MIYQDLTDIPIEQFGGYVPAMPPIQVPPGASWLCRDVEFPMGAVRTRGGLAKVYGVDNGIPANASINGLKTYLTPTLAQRLMVWDSLGNLYKESPQGLLNLIASRPQGAGTLYDSNTLFGREYQAFYDISGGRDIPRQYDDTYWDRVSQVGPGASPNAATSGTAGNIPAGIHQVSVAFITRQGYITAASAPSTWTQGANKQVDITNVPIGPPNVVARLLLFTPVITPPATTGNFFSLPNGSSQIASSIMLIDDNTNTSITLDFTDTVLISGFQANFLFTQRELGECAFAGGYNARTAWLGERAKQINFTNMTFDGGFGAAGSSPASTSSGPLNCGTGTDVNVGGAQWLNPGNIAVGAAQSNGVAINFGGNVSDYLQATNFGFAIPSNATILGIVAIIKKKQGAIARVLVDNSVKIVKAGVGVGTDHRNGQVWPTAFTAFTYGAASDLWGTTWTPGDVNSANFGVQIQARNDDTGNFASPSVQAFVTIKVFYTTPAAGAGVGPLGWTQGATYAGGSSAITSGLLGDWQDAFAITGDGITAVRGLITQLASKDYLGTAIINRNTEYRVRVRLARNNLLNAGTVHINLSSVSAAFTTVGLAVNAAQLTTNYVEFDALLTAAMITVPADLVIQVYADGTPTNGGVFLVDSIEPYQTGIPFNYSTAWFSHAFNPESFDSTTSAVQVRPNDGTQLRAAIPNRNNYYLAKDHYLCYVTDDGVNEPASWPVNEVSATIGICGPNAWDSNEEWFVFAERSGGYLCWGSDPVKITQEIDRDASAQGGRVTWQSINWAYGHTIWVRIDRSRKRILFGVPINGSTVPNFVFMMDYQWLESAPEIASTEQVTYSSFTGKILSHGRGRRWTPWYIAAASMTFAERSDGTVQPFFGNSVGNSKIYQQMDVSVQSSDDGVAINSLYRTFYCPSHMDEQMLKLGADRKLLGGLKWNAKGAGQLLLSVLKDNTVTNLRNYILSISPLGDGERSVNLHSERFSVEVGTNAPGAWFQMEKFIFKVKRDASIPLRGLNQ